jgi:ATPase family associated with various cellular activities (AAA)
VRLDERGVNRQESFAGVTAVLANLDRRLRLEVVNLLAGGRQHDPFRGLYIADKDVSDVMESLGRGAGTIDWISILERRLQALASRFALHEQEVQVLLAAVLPDLDLRYESSFAYVQDDVTRKRPTIDLLLRLLWPEPDKRIASMALFEPAARLRRTGLVRVEPEVSQSSSLLARSVRTDERIVSYLLGRDDLDDRVAPMASMLAITAHQNELPRPVLEQLGDVRELDSSQGVVVLEGPPGVGKSTAAMRLASLLGLNLLAIDVPTLLRSDLAPATLAQISLREARLQGALIYLSGGGAMWDDGDRCATVRDAFLEQHRRFGGLLVISGRGGFEMPPVIDGQPVTRIALEVPSAAQRFARWTTVLAGVLPSDSLRDISAAFRLTYGQIEDASAIARRHASASTERHPGLNAEDVYAACRAVSGHGLAAVADEIKVTGGWDDLVLPPDSMAQLHELCATVRGRSTVLDQWGFGDKFPGGTATTAMFAGPPGTGKGWAANIVAGVLGKSLYRVDLAKVVSKWIGETEKNLDRVFRAAEDSNAVLFLDEADALFGKRTEIRDSHDRYANLEISYLLQKMETYEGLAILATNMRQLVDEAFMRRLSFTVLFPMPEEADRLRIWQALWPPDMPGRDDVDLVRLARFRLTGGNIKNVLLAAAYTAAAEGTRVRTRHLLHGVKREYQKVGKQLTQLELAD